jgi:hypothetical protein
MLGNTKRGIGQDGNERALAMLVLKFNNHQFLTP